MRSNAKCGVFGMMLGLVILSSGCATRSVCIRLDPLPTTVDNRRIEVSSVHMAEDSYAQAHIGCFGVAFSRERYEAILNESIIRTLGGISLSATAGDPKALRLYVVVRRYLEAISNHGGRNMACVGWCLADPNGQLLVQDQFYSYSLGEMVVTPQMIRNWLTERIVSRIAQTCRQYALTGKNDPSWTPQLSRTYNTFDEVRAELPDSMSSAHTGLPIPIVISGSLKWETGKFDEPIDWPKYIHELSTIQKQTKDVKE